VEQGGLRALGELEREDVGAVEHAGALALEGAHERERERDRPGVPADVGARARLVEVEARGGRIAIGEDGALDVEGREGDAAALEGGEQGLLPLRVLVNDD
jgi:hypothetical protein